LTAHATVKMCLGLSPCSHCLRLHLFLKDNELLRVRYACQLMFLCTNTAVINIG